MTAIDPLYSIEQIKNAVCTAMPRAFYARLEVGRKARKLHVHVLAHEAPNVRHHVCNENTLDWYAKYLNKNQVPGDNLSAGIYLEARENSLLKGCKRLPETSFKREIPNGLK